MEITNRTLKKHGLRIGAYDGARKRRYVLFENAIRDGNLIEWRHEFDTRREAKAMALRIIAIRS